MSKKVAFITGITGQDGSYLAEQLLDKEYVVHGMKRRASSLNTSRIDHIYQDPHDPQARLMLHYGDMTDSSQLARLIDQIQPDEIYNLAAQSHVAVSFETPEYTANVDGLGTLRLLEALRQTGIDKQCRFFQASTSELFGQVKQTPQNEHTPFHPRSPYAAAKLYAYWATINYREAYGLYACNGILFNHESPRRGETFVTRKITRALAAISQGLEDCLFLGNLEAKRDWGHARDYMLAAYQILQQEQADDYVIATGEQHSVREFLIKCAGCIGLQLSFSGRGEKEIAVVESADSALAPAVRPGQVIMRIDPKYFRPAEVDTLLGDATKATGQLGWRPQCDFDNLCQEMMVADMHQAQKQALLKQHGY